MQRKFLSTSEAAIRRKFDAVRFYYTSVYGESVFIQCPECNGTGLYVTTRDGYIWDGSSYCFDCDGYGGKFVLGEVIFECSVCKDKSPNERLHCKKCDGYQYLDWVTNALSKSVGKSYRGYLR